MGIREDKRVKEWRTVREEGLTKQRAEKGDRGKKLNVKSIGSFY